MRPPARLEADQNIVALLDNLFFPRPLIVKNSDNIDHNVFIEDQTLDAHVDTGLMPPGEQRVFKVNWEPNSILRVSCKVHPTMISYIANIQSKQYKTLDLSAKKKQYTFELSELELKNGEIKAHLLLAKFEPVEARLRPGQTAVFDLIRFDKKGSVELRLYYTHNG